MTPHVRYSHVSDEVKLARNRPRLKRMPPTVATARGPTRY